MKQTIKKTVVAAILFLVLSVCIGVTAQAAIRVLYVGRTYSINVKGSYKWYSTNKRIVRVNSKTKKITPRKAGTTYIKGVKKVHNKKIVKKIKVIVKKPYLNKKKATVTVGKKLTLKLRGMVVTRWTSSNKKIATVSSSGAVKTRKSGTVKITATGKDKKKYTCVLKVNAKPKQIVPTATPTKAPENHTSYMIAHRGDTSTAPENTMAAFQSALLRGYKAVETDVQFTKDNVPVILHDSTIKRTSNGSGRIMDLTFDEVRQYDFGSWKSEAYADEKIPSFQEFIKFCKENSVHPYIELKTTITQNDIEKIQTLLDIVSAAGMQKDVSWFSFSYNLVEMVKERDQTADIGVVLHGGEVVTEQFIEKMKNLKTGLNTVFFSHYARKITPVVLERCKEEQIQLVARDIKNIQSLYALDLYYRAAFADGF
ncbi:MAG: glycerophosphodiester phosphodiesterase family protein [Ruminococcus sp.]|nr:glycerophosphodiester phosphodiesterase family protein [Ruminococcus sp.]